MGEIAISVEDLEALLTRVSELEQSARRISKTVKKECLYHYWQGVSAGAHLTRREIELIADRQTADPTELTEDDGLPP